MKPGLFCHGRYDAIVGLALLLALLNAVDFAAFAAAQEKDKPRPRSELFDLDEDDESPSPPPAPEKPAPHENPEPQKPRETPEKSETRPKPAEGRVIDLLSLIDPATSAAAGSWTKTRRGELLSPAEGRTWIEAPHDVPAEYDMVVEFTRMAGKRGIAQILARGDTKFVWILCGLGGANSAFLDVGGKGWGNPTDVPTPQLVRTGERHRSVLKVRSDGVSAFLDDEQIADWPTDYSDLTTNLAFPGQELRRVAVGTTGTAVMFHKIELVEMARGPSDDASPPAAPATQPQVEPPSTSPSDDSPPAPPADGYGLKAELFADRRLSKNVLTRYDQQVNFYWALASPHPAIPANDFSVRWSGFLRPPKPGPYKFRTVADDEIRVWLDEQLILKGHGQQDVTVELGKRPHDLRVEFVEHGGWAGVTLQWQPPGSKVFTIVPPEALFHEKTAAEKARANARPVVPKGTGVLMEIFAGTNLQGRSLKRVDRQINWYGGEAALGAGLPADRFSVRFTTWLKAPKPGSYRLSVRSDDGHRLRLDGRLLAEEWRRGEFASTVLVELTDKPHALTVEYYELTGHARFVLQWEQIGGFAQQIVPAEAFFTEKAAAMRAR